MCILTNERYKTYQTGFLFCRLGHALAVGLGVLRDQIQIPSCCLSVMLSPPKPLDKIKPSLMFEGVCNGILLPRPLGPWGGVKRSNIILFQLQTLSQFQRFSYQTLCVYSQMKDTKHIRQNFYFVAWIMP